MMRRRSNGNVDPTPARPSTLQAAPPPVRSQQTRAYNEIRERVQRRLLAELSPVVDTNDAQSVRRALEQIFIETLQDERLPMSRSDRNLLFEQIVADVLGYGPIEPFLRDETVTEILVNGPDRIYIERAGILEETDVQFRDNDEVMHVIDRIVTPLGRRVDESSPMVDARLPGGSRVNIIIPPLAIDGPSISIRKFARAIFDIEDLIKVDTLTRTQADFLRACVEARLNIVVSGGTSTGKTTLLNALSGFLPDNERIITIEDSAELQLHQRHVVRLEARPPQHRGQGPGAHPAIGDQRAAHAPGPHRRRRGPRRRGAGHAPGDEHGPRRLAHHGALQLTPRHTVPHLHDGPDGRDGDAAGSHPRADRGGL